jgi:hypothetical protein
VVIRNGKVPARSLQPLHGDRLVEPDRRFQYQRDAGSKRAGALDQRVVRHDLVHHPTSNAGSDLTSQ